ncbi:DEAD-domain-containing protein [Macroventuria anomochaeta]|uniref:DEAD-domain-containing protein n=1 Tax=Macroventuria anomochaeta TaxID=301207 RepID=A0ACB6S4N2_9PLEO|nr:DEAD-domain-containing protein [Macroventuria anomochaeta]KAF2628087.1 DEAD-domain-containing protein [Macroventuria anomochaeta]
MFHSARRSPVHLLEPVRRHRRKKYSSNRNTMATLNDVEGLSEVIGRAIQEHLERSNINVAWPQIDGLVRPILRVEAFLEDAGPGSPSSQRSERVASVSNPSISLPRQDQDTMSPSFKTQSHNSDATEEVVNGSDSRRKGTGGLRISQNQTIQEDHSEHQRQMQVDTRNFPKRKKVTSEKFVFQPSSLDKLIIGIWEQLHGSINLDPKAIFEQFKIAPAGSSDVVHHNTADVTAMDMLSTTTDGTHDSFSQMNMFCRKVTQASRVCRSIEMIVQARWTELFEEQIQFRTADVPELSATKHRKAVFMEACQDFGWSEKELRNKMAIWRGYKEVKDAAGWAALVFAGMGIYRFCKYRVGFDKDTMRRLRNLRKRLEVAADTLHPHWRQLLTIVGEPQTLQYPGHPHEWVVFEDGTDPVPLRQTYQDQERYFAFEHIDESIIDESVWGCEDPRWMPQPNPVARINGQYICASCGEQQSDDPKANACFCFPSLFGCVKRKPPPIQVFRTPDGKNNGLVALTSFERGAAIGELVGLITRGMSGLDVMDSSTPLSNYQIWQGRIGNYTRFANHSCKPNAQSSNFTWLDTQRVLIVSKGIEAGAEITLDYGDKYWAGLDKACLCGEACCRYRTRDHDSEFSSSDEEILEHQVGSRKRRKLSPSAEDSDQSSEDRQAAAPAPVLLLSNISRIKTIPQTARNGVKTTTPLQSSVPPTKEKLSFASIDVAPWLVASLASMEIKKPTGIQAACIPEILKGRDCIGGSRTGTGKTVAFSVPIMQKWAEDPVGIFGLIITPTRELAIQIFEQVKAISAPQSMKPILITGGADQREQAINLASRPHIVVATPGRLAEHIKTSGEDTICGLRRVKFVVFDEADRLLTPGKGSMLPDLETCLSVVPPPTQRQTLLFTATVTPEVLALKEQPRPGRPPIFVCEVDTEDLAIPPKLQQKYIQTPVTHKECYLHVALETPENLKKSVIIFCNRTKTATLLEYMLRLLDHRVTALHSGLKQSDRVNNLARFRAQAARILVATDVAARGLDIPEVALVINYDVPRDPDDYIHRVGRTARAGRVGTSITLIGQRDVELILAIEKRVGKKMEEYEEEGVSIEGRVVRDALKPVTEKKREAMLQIEEGRDVLGKRKTGMQKRRAN